MSPLHATNEASDDDDEFAFELERLDEALSSGSVIDQQDQAFQPAGDSQSHDSSLQRAARVLHLMRRVRQFEEHSLHSAESPAGQNPHPCLGDTPSESANLGTHRSQPPAEDGAGYPPTMELIPKTIGRFRVRRLLGQGGFGLVFLADDTALQRPVAIKIPRLETLATITHTDRFLREGRAAAALNHPHIVPVYEVGEFGGVPYIASAYCPGLNLAEWLQQRSEPVSPRTAAALVARMADAAQHAHQRGILHRDLKPANILLEFPEPSDNETAGGDPANDSSVANHEFASVGRTGSADDHAIAEFDLAARARINDFGLAKLDGAELATQTTGTLGTPSYMPPEQADPAAGKLGPPADIYSLGAILYELLAGRPPFQEATVLATLDAVRHRQPKPPRKIVPGVPADLDAITLKCLEKKPQHRYDSAAALVDDLERFLTQRPVRARRIRSAERFLRWCRRNPAMASLVFAVVLLAIGSTISSLRLAVAQRETRRALDDAVKANRQAVESEYSAQVALAHSIQQTSAPGQRSESLRAASRRSVGPATGHRFRHAPRTS